MFTLEKENNEEKRMQGKPLTWDEFFNKVKKDKVFRENVGASKNGKLSLEEKGQIYSIYRASDALNRMEKYKNLSEGDRQIIIQKGARVLFEKVKSGYLAALREQKNKKMQTANPSFKQSPV